MHNYEDTHSEAEVEEEATHLKGILHPQVNAWHVCRSPCSSVSAEAPRRTALLSDARDRPGALQITVSMVVSHLTGPVCGMWLHQWEKFEILPINTK